MNYNDDYEFDSYETDEERYGLNNGGFVRVAEEVKKEENIKRKIPRKGPGKLYFICLWIAFILSALGITVSIFTSVARSNLKKEIESAVIKYSLKVEKEAGGYELIPLSDSELSTAISGTKEEKCFDSNGNAVCQIYKVIVENDSDYLVYFKSTLELIANENSGYKNLKWAEINNNSNTPMVFGQPKTMSTTDWKPNYGVGANTSANFYIVIWLSDNGYSQNYSDYGSFIGNVTFEALAGDKITSTFSGR